MRRRQAPTTPPPEEFTDEEFLLLSEWCSKKHPAHIDDLPELLEACLDHHRGVGNYMACWLAAARTWVRNEVKWHPKQATMRPAKSAQNRQNSLRLFNGGG